MMHRTIATCPSFRAAVRRASVARSRGTAVLALVLAAVTLAIAQPAFADTDGSVMYSNTDGGAYNAVVRDVTNRYDAALICLGYTRDSVTDAQMETKLSNEGTGGRFWDFAQTFFTDVGLDNIPSWSPTWLYGSIMANGWIYGDAFARSLYWTETTQELYNGALEDLQTVLRGGSLGGETLDGIGLIPNYYVSSGGYYAIEDTSGIKRGVRFPGFKITNTDGYLPFGSDVTFVPNEHLFDRFQGGLENYDLIISIQLRDRWSYKQPYISLYLVPKNGYSVSYGTYEDTNNYLGGGTYQTVTGYTLDDGVIAYEANRMTDTVVLDGNTLSFRDDVVVGSWTRASGIAVHNVTGFTRSGGGGGTNNWPAPAPPELPDPGNPTQPTVPSPTDPEPDPQPDPGAPVIPIPGIDLPDIGDTTVNIEPDEPEGTDPTDYTPWLRKIYNTQILVGNNIVNDLGNHCQHLQDALESASDQIVKKMRELMLGQTNAINSMIRGQIGYLAGRIGTEFASLKDYLHELFVWLAAQMDFSFTDGGYGLNDTSIVAWLKKIYAKMGTGGVTTRPSDPVENPDDWFDWLMRAIQNFTAGLIASANDMVSGLGELLSSLVSKFPFGIPFMVLEVITLLAADPVTPQFALSYTVFGTQVSYSVDLAAYDTAAATIRAMVYIVYGGYLLSKTPKVIAEMMGVFG